MAKSSNSNVQESFTVSFVDHAGDSRYANRFSEQEAKDEADFLHSQGMQSVSIQRVTTTADPVSWQPSVDEAAVQDTPPALIEGEADQVG